MTNKILIALVALLAIVSVGEYWKISQLKSEIAQKTIDLAAADLRAAAEARSSLTASLGKLRPEMLQAMAWLHGYYKSPDGLQREGGLWIDGHPDYEGIGAWVFDVYLQRRLVGDTDGEARAAIENAIRGSDEWRVKHSAKK